MEMFLSRLTLAHSVDYLSLPSMNLLATKHYKRKVTGVDESKGKTWSSLTSLLRNHVKVPDPMIGHVLRRAESNRPKQAWKWQTMVRAQN